MTSSARKFSLCFRYIVVIQTNPIKLQSRECACAHVCSNKLLSIQLIPNTAEWQREKKVDMRRDAGATYAEEMKKNLYIK